MINKRPNILIINAVPTNNGDAALLFSLYDKLNKLNINITIATQQYSNVKKIYPEINFIKDISDYKYIHRYKLISFLASLFLFLLNPAYRKSDIIIGAPGGYLNSFYRLNNKLIIYRIAKIFKKRTIIYSQSVGPFKSNKIPQIVKFLNNIDYIFVRDEQSNKNLIKIGYSGRIVKSVDAAFLMTPFKKNNIKIIRNKKVAISVREWTKDASNISIYLNLIKSIILFLEKRGYEVTFLSTCQGLADYVDDSIIAENIYKLLPNQVKGRCYLDNHFYNLNKFRERLNDFDFIIGTRLHMCILSMLNDIPAFNIIYEFKSKELYKYMGLIDTQINYNSATSEALVKIENFLKNLPSIKNKMTNSVAKLNLEANNSFLFLQSLIFDESK